MKVLRPYQQRAKEDIFKAFETHDIVFLVLATGGGKSVIFTDVIREFILNEKRTKLIAHREELIGQAHEHLKGAKIYSGIIMGDYPTRYEFPSQVCSIQTIARRKNLPPAHLIVIDEGHHVTDSNSYSKILAQYPDAKVLIVSATPYRLSGEGFKELVKGKETKLIINSTIKSLIIDGWLVPFRYCIPSFINTENLHTSRGDYIDDEVYNKVRLIPLVDSYLKFAPGKQGIVYGCNVRHSIEIAQQYNGKGIPAAHLDADTPDEDYMKDGVLQLGRKSIIRDFKAGLLKAVSNVGILTEGTDFPNCDFVQWACLTKSLSKFLQGCGRASRPLPGLVDNYIHSQDRRDAIATSAKSHGIILDNTGMFKEHGFPDDDHDWEMYFNGTKGKEKEKDKDKDLEILVYVYEDNKGVRRRTKNIEEVEGHELIEVTTEIKQKVINLKSLSEFDRLYGVYRAITRINKPGYMAARKYIEYCENNNFLMVPEVWDYMKKVLVDDVLERENKLAYDREHKPEVFGDDPQFYLSALEKVRNSGVSVNFLITEREKYQERNKTQMDNYLKEKAMLKK